MNYINTIKDFKSIENFIDSEVAINPLPESQVKYIYARAFAIAAEGKDSELATFFFNSVQFGWEIMHFTLSQN